MKKLEKNVWLSVCLAFALTSPVFGQGRHERRMAQLAESAQPRRVAGGVEFQRSASHDETYDAVLTFLKKQGYTVESADKEVGQIITAMDIKGGWRQTGTRVQITLIKEAEIKTTVRVAVVEQKRFKALQAEPWGDPKVNEKESAKLAEALKAALNAAPQG